MSTKLKNKQKLSNDIYTVLPIVSDTIYCESCIDTMDRMESKIIDVVLTSPPYNIIRPNSTDRGYDLYKDGMSNKEYMKWTISIFNGFDKVVKENGVVLYNMSYGTENTTLMSLTIAEIINKTNFTLADIIVWKKSSATPNNVSHNKLTRIVEFVYVFCRKDEINTFTCNKKELKKRDTGQAIYKNVFNFIKAPNNDKSTDLNKATFSTIFARKLLQMYAKPNSLVYDAFMGTGTTANACLIEKHNFIGSEISQKQVDYANKRLEIIKKQTTLF